MDTVETWLYRSKSGFNCITIDSNSGHACNRLVDYIMYFPLFALHMQTAKCDKVFKWSLAPYRWNISLFAKVGSLLMLGNWKEIVWSYQYLIIISFTAFSSLRKKLSSNRGCAFWKLGCRNSLLQSWIFFLKIGRKKSCKLIIYVPATTHYHMEGKKNVYIY